MPNPFSTFFKRIWKSLTDPRWYQQVLKQRFSTALGYLFWFLVLVSLAWTIPGTVLMVTFGPEVRQLVENVKQDAPTMYPKGLVITVKDGVLRTNVREPYRIELPARWKTFVRDKDVKPRGKKWPTHFITIDTKAKAEDYSKYDTLILVTQRSLVVPDKESHGTRVISLEKGKDLVITKQKYDTVLREVLPYANTIVTLYNVIWICLLVLGPFLIGGALLAGKLLWLLLLSLLTLLLSMLMRRRLRYWELYKLGMYAVTGPTLLGVLFSYLPFFWFPLASTLYFLIWTGVILSKFPKR